jgi:hypothetical protein
MGLFTHTADRKREPLGGREADGFGKWLKDSTQQVSESYEVLCSSLPVGHPGRSLAQSAHRDFVRWLHLWKLLEMGKSPSASDEDARDDFEVRLIAHVMDTHDFLELTKREDRASGRSMLDAFAGYERACEILAQYLGIRPIRVSQCNGEQDWLMALGEGR